MNGAAGAAQGLDADRSELLRRLRSRALDATPRSSSPGRLRVSLFFFSSDADADIEGKHDLVLECAKLAEKEGLHAVWVPERHFDPFGAPYPNPMLLLSALAACTSEIKLRAGSVVLPLHDPLLVAEDIAVVQSLSKGRLGVSFASGWHPRDFVLNPGSYDGRKSDLVEKYRILRNLWLGEEVSRTGPGGSFPVRCYPKISAQPECWLTSSSNVSTWSQAAELGINVLTGLLEQSLTDLAGKIEIYRKVLIASGHAPDDRQVTCMMHTHVAASGVDVSARVSGPLTRYLTEHLRLFEKSLGKESPIRADAFSEEDRNALLAQGVRRYIESSGLFGDVSKCLAMATRLWEIGVTEVGCLVDFGLTGDQVLECVTELGALQRAMTMGSRKAT